MEERRAFPANVVIKLSVTGLVLPLNRLSTCFVLVSREINGFSRKDAKDLLDSAVALMASNSPSTLSREEDLDAAM